MNKSINKVGLGLWRITPSCSRGSRPALLSVTSEEQKAQFLKECYTIPGGGVMAFP